MARVSPYYSVKLTDPDVYHNHDNCSAGRKVVGHNRRQGTHRYRQCNECMFLSEQQGEYIESRQNHASDGRYSLDERATASGS